MKKRFLGFSCSLALVAMSACSEHDHGATTATATLSVVAGAQDAHCAGSSVRVDPAACKAAADPAAPASSTSDYGATLFSSEGDDDDCKYHLKWSSPQVTANTSPVSKTLATSVSLETLTPLHGDTSSSTVAQSGNATFEVVLTNKADGSPVTGAPIEIEAYLDEMHPAPNTKQTSNETSPGTYTVGPIAFDASGRWTVRFHIHDECGDAETSPHGHVAFFVQVDLR